MFRRFGAGQPEKMQERVTLYLLGMPDSHGVVFPPRVDIEQKLDMLEEEREYLLEMCPSELRNTYEDGKEETLIRLLLFQVPTRGIRRGREDSEGPGKIEKVQ